MPAGRPSIYTPELVQSAWNYVNDCPDAIPSIEGLCDAINIARATAYDWAKQDDKEFSDILDALMRKQAKMLINKGLENEWNSTIAKLILTKHGYSDKMETEHSGKLDLGQLSEEQLDARIQALMEGKER